MNFQAHIFMLINGTIQKIVKEYDTFTEAMQDILDSECDSAKILDIQRRVIHEHHRSHHHHHLYA